MATSRGPDPNPFQLLPSDTKSIEEVSKYAKARQNELEVLSVKVQKMGFLRSFFDSKVARKDKGNLTINFNLSDPEKIKKDLENCINLFENILDGVDKVNDGNKTAEEKENPYIIMIDLSEKITDMFDYAQCQIEITTSRTVSKVYNEMLARQPELENKMKRLECIFLKQQLLAESRNREMYRSNLKKATDGGIAYKEQNYNEVTDEVKDLKERNTELKKLVKQTDKQVELVEELKERFKHMSNKDSV